MAEWFWWDWSLSQWPTGFFQCFDAVGWVIWPVKIVLEMTYKVSSGTLTLYSLTHYYAHQNFALLTFGVLERLFLLRRFRDDFNAPTGECSDVTTVAVKHAYRQRKVFALVWVGDVQRLSRAVALNSCITINNENDKSLNEYWRRKVVIIQDRSRT